MECLTDSSPMKPARNSCTPTTMARSAKKKSGLFVTSLYAWFVQILYNFTPMRKTVESVPKKKEAIPSVPKKCMGLLPNL